MKDPKYNVIPTIFPQMKAYLFRSPISIMNKLYVLASEDGNRYEHVSAHGVDERGNLYTPHWDEMCYIKDQFFDEEQVVVQIHPKKSQYVNAHGNVLHLWHDKSGIYEYPYND